MTSRQVKNRTNEVSVRTFSRLLPFSLVRTVLKGRFIGGENDAKLQIQCDPNYNCMTHLEQTQLGQTPIENNCFSPVTGLVIWDIKTTSFYN